MEPRTDWQEDVAPDEQSRMVDYGRTIGSLQEDRDRGRAMQRFAHPKPLAGARARFVVLPGVPEPLRVGLFAAPGEYDAWVRFSNASAKPQSDAVADVRGLAFKVLGVPGRKLIPGMEDATTQDFSLINSPIMSVRDAGGFMSLVHAASSPLLLLPRLLWSFGAGTFAVIGGLQKMLGQKVDSMATTRFYTPVPVRWGAYAAKYTLIPRAPAPATPTPRSPTYLTDEITARLAAGPVEYDFAVQLYVDARKTPIEDATVAWPESDSPFHTVARLTVLAQDLRSAAGQKQQAYVESLSFDPWHAPVEFRPLGSIMRARAEAYRVSSMARKAAREPEAMESF